MKFTTPFLIIASAVLSMTNATPVPVTQESTDLVIRNSSLTIFPRGIATGLFNIKPDPAGGPCGAEWDSIITVNDPGDQSQASPLCRFLYQYITIPTDQGYGYKRVSFIYHCAPQSTSGLGGNEIKFIVTGPSTFPGDHGTFPANLLIVDDKSAVTNINIPVEMAYYYNINNPAAPGVKMFTFETMKCLAT